MKNLKKLAIILRALGITANVVSEEITYNGVHEYDNNFCECDKGLIHFDVWHDDEEFELHFTFKNTWFMIPYIWIVCCKLLAK